MNKTAAALSLAALLGAPVLSAKEFRGVWVATVGNLDFPRCSSAWAYKKNFTRLAAGLARKGCNAMIFQVRSNCDAFYPSRHAPYSVFLTGKEGRGLKDFDPLKFMIAESRRRGMEFHAWFNPYRVVRETRLSKAAYLATLAPGNFARKNPHLVLAVPLGNKRISLMLNPGEPAVIRHVVEVVREAAQRYAPDAIHFDDYFYPYDSKNIPDGAAFKRYNPRRLSLGDWRRNNVNLLISQVRRVLNQVNVRNKCRIRFGISPFGIWGNYSPRCPMGSRTSGKESYFLLCADSRLWVKKRMVDYIVPQIYWHRSHPQAPFTPLLNWWCQTVRGTGVKLYIGHALYRFGEAGWGRDELRSQLSLVRSKPEAAGSVLFSARHLLTPPSAAIRLGTSRIWR